MAGVFASVAVEWALDKLASFVPASLALSSSSSSSTTVTTASEDVEVLQRLERTMLRIRATLHDAEDRWDIREESAKLRLKELKELAYAAEDVVEDYDNEVERCELQATTASVGKGKRKLQENENKAYSSDSDTVAVPVELAVQARRLIERFDEIKEYSDKFALSENDGDRRFALDINTLRRTSSVVYEKSIIGRKKDKETVVGELLPRKGDSMEVPVSVLPIVGMGGLGKTALAQLVYNDPRMHQSFDTWAWVCVSEEQFDVGTITKNIISSITKTRRDPSELADLQEELVAITEGKKVLLVLDDVWNERRDLWELLCVPMSRTRICNIIVTTRSEAVARLVQTMPFYRIKGLSSEDSWSLFKQAAFAAHQDKNIPVNLIQIGNHIVDRCKGLPLAIKTLGSILRCETDEVRWRDVLGSKLWDLEESRSGVLPALELSYKHIPIYLKRCFVALSLFPKDYKLEKLQVIRLWKSLGLLHSDRYGSDDYIGSLYFDELFQRSFLQVEYGSQFYIMHDLLNDLACFLGAEEFFRLKGGTSIKIPPNARYISIIEGDASAEILTASHSVRAIILLPGAHVNTINLEMLLLNCKKLRALTYLPLFKARYLPRGIGGLINLHALPVIYLSRCGCCCNIGELRRLNKIRELRIHGLSSVARIEDSNKAQLQSKKHLQSLYLDFGFWIDNCQKLLQADNNQNRLQGEPATLSHKKLLDSLQPHTGLRKLSIWCYESQKYSSWLGNASFSNLTHIFLSECKSQHLPTLGELPALWSLVVADLQHVEYIGREFCSNIPGIKGFPSLENLQFHGMRELSVWSNVDLGEFRCSHALYINGANKLRSLPPVPFMSLVTLRLRYCGNLAAVPESATLCELVIQCCKSLHQLPMFVSLWKLEIADCPKLSAVGSLPSLTTLNITGSFADEEILCRLLNCHSSLECISVTCHTTTCITLQPQSLPLLTKFHLRCWELQYCDGLAGLTSLQELKVEGCPKLPIHSLLPRNLRNLEIVKFPSLLASRS